MQAAATTRRLSSARRPWIDLKMAILHEKPDNPVLALDHTNRGELLYRDERFEDALEESKLALGTADRVRTVVIDAHVLQVRSLLKLRRVDEVIPLVRRRHREGQEIRCALRAPRPWPHADRHDYPAAIRDYGQALEIRPDDARLLAERGWAYVVYESPETGPG